MVQTVNQQEKTELLERIASLYNFFQENSNEETANKAKQLGIKLNEGEFSIAFCGHFSAGKSSMINKLIGENLLPSSPIPTSANLVKVKAGEEYAKVIFKTGKPRLYPAPYDYESVKTYCKDGDQIQSIEISHDTTALPREAVIMDTPGIDSTDDAHRIATESALHLADLVFYVMDYNHVQSELNFLFTKELTDVGKEVYLVINQIDKHRDEELSFDQFKQSVKDSFASWGVKPKQIFYTTLKQPEHAQNQFEELQQFIRLNISKREELLPVSVLYSLKKLAQDHHDYLLENKEDDLLSLESQLADVPNEERGLLPQKLSEAQNQLSDLDQEIETFEKNLDDEIDSVLKNAYLMPYQTRELAESYLQSRQPDFKVGMFFAKQKTEQERELRLDQFYLDFLDKIKSQLEWHLKEHVLNVLKEQELQDGQLLSMIQGLTIPFSKENLAQSVKEGARLSGDYVLNYTNDVAELAKKHARNAIAEIKAEIIRLFKAKKQDLKAGLMKQYDQLNKLTAAWQGKCTIEEQLLQMKLKMEKLLTGEYEHDLTPEKLNEIFMDHEEWEVIYNSADLKHENIEEMNATPTDSMSDETAEVSVEAKTDVNGLVRRLNDTAEQLNPVPGFKKIAAELIEKANRLEGKGFTVALFGAFSAGKSSFANALMGAKLLPVSPNPTTAAINKIMPVDEQHSHGTVLVKLKDPTVLFDDVNRSLGVFQLSSSSFDEALTQIKKVMDQGADFDSNEKTHFAFLHAFYKGFNAYRNQLGEIIQTDLTEFRDFVAKEEKSCLVDLIEVYFDCELTRQGITLVDTPGADSINARHTGVAFDYIKNSDAILFVTYYNHAFSKADREFLIQLGRVKEAFELDKMFFVVNAIDLANSEEELNSVLEYVGDQLIKYGIRKPNLFPISSLLAIKEKLENDHTNTSRIREFEQRFYSFINQDLMQIAVTSAEGEWQRALDQLRRFIQSSEEDKDQRAQKREKLNREHSELNGFIQNQSSSFVQKQFEQEADELIYYIKQRVFYRFSDFFKESFNPSVLKDDGRNLKKALNSALEDFLASFGFDFAQELRATTVRVEVHIVKLLKQMHDNMTRDMKKVNEELSFSHFEGSKMESLDFESAFNNLERSRFNKAMSFFKNPKSFFEKNDKKYLSDELESSLQEPSEQYLQEGSLRLKNHYAEQLEHKFGRMLSELLEETAEFYQGMLAALSDDVPIDKLKEIERHISSSRD